jgi:enoyl-CoA hydratase/carnithine racemase
MSTDAELIVQREGATTRLTLNRPRRRNALSPQLVDGLLAALAAAAGDGTRLVVIQGSGSAMCAGFDFSGIEGSTDAELVLRFVRLEQLLQAVRHAPFATLALAQGASFGAGADLVAACSRRIAAPGATFRMPGLRFGVVLGTRRLADVVGTDAARHLLESSRVFDADEALRLGFITEIADPGAWARSEAEALQAATTLPADAQQALLARTVTDTRDADMAALVASVTVAGLRDRIIEFIAQSRRPTTGTDG